MASFDRELAATAVAPIDAELVSVILPAFNAERYIDETLRSVRGQTHRALQILVIDDGSTDATLEIARLHARADQRITVLTQPNAGVAAARNLGLSQARGRFVAPIDADDLWAPGKIERQLAAMRASGGRAGLVYCWYARIDDCGRITDRVVGALDEGQVLDAMCKRNIVGNGSAPLMLRDAVLAAGGYDPGLRARAAQGCEDYKLYFQIAESHEFALVRDFLVGYRACADSMSQQFEQMIRSRAVVTAEVRARHPDKARLLRQGNVRAKRFHLTHSLRWGRFGSSARIMIEMLREDAIYSAIELMIAAGRGIRRLIQRAGRSAGLVQPQYFAIGEPELPTGCAERLRDSGRILDAPGLGQSATSLAQ